MKALPVGGGTPDFKWRGWSNGGENQTQGLPTKPSKITGANINPPKTSNSRKTSLVVFYSQNYAAEMRRLALPRIFTLFWMPPNNTYLNQATQKNACQIFLPEETKSNCAWKLTSRKKQGLCSLFWSEARLHVSGFPRKRKFFSIFEKYAFTRSVSEIFSLAYATKVKTMEIR